MAFNVSNLPAYVQENHDLLIKEFALVGNGTRKRVGLQTGIKKDAYINYLSLVPTLQQSSCGFEPSGDVALTQRTIETAPLSVKMSLCPDTLLGKYAEYEVKVAPNDPNCPFERYIVEDLINGINKKVEKLIWQGDKTQTTDANVKWINGLLKIAGAESSVVTETITGTDAYADIEKVIAKIPDEALELGAEVYVSSSVYRKFMNQMVTKNYFHYSGAQNDFPLEFVFPGTDVKVVYTPGLSGSTSILATFPQNIIYGTDIENGNEDIRVWWSEDHQEFRILAKWNSGVQIAFPDMVVLATV